MLAARRQLAFSGSLLSFRGRFFFLAAGTISAVDMEGLLLGREEAAAARLPGAGEGCLKAPDAAVPGVKPALGNPVS